MYANHICINSIANSFEKVCSPNWAEEKQFEENYVLGRGQYDMKALLRQLREGSNQSGRLLWDFLSASFHQNNISN